MLQTAVLDSTTTSGIIRIIVRLKAARENKHDLYKTQTNTPTRRGWARTTKELPEQRAVLSLGSAIAIQ
jgi:hypothetical protein